ncbi:hypothetical protein PVL29_022813 [Vitis rotundifolia]|uniref:BRISC and BRCA1-A complex member 1 n=1 Tax=Vitis rotundifolia TaxID=103349 RepID=A0AA38YWZ2_VITRO|nr:hypothetical protein PVL29_022813 [Vitis rotundifolia]
MEGMEAQSSSPFAYALNPSHLFNKDILLRIDVDVESMVEMKVTGSKGRPITSMYSIKQAIFLFVHARLAINSDHRFAFAALGKTTSWLQREFSSEFDSAIAALRSLLVDGSCGNANLTQLFRHQWPVNLKLFTLDTVYLHNKPGLENCPQKVYDALVNTLEHVSEHEGHTRESRQGLTRVLFHYMCVLSSYPQQRCQPDDVNIPKPLTKEAVIFTTWVVIMHHPS